MFKVLSTKLNSEEIDSFNEAAKQQGLSKAGFLRSLVQNYLDSNNDENSLKDVSLDKNSSPEKFQEPEAFNNISSPPKEHKSLLNKDADGASIQKLLPVASLPTEQKEIQKPLVNTTKTLTELSDKNIVDKPIDTKKIAIKEQSTDKEVLKVATETRVDSRPNVVELIILGLIGIGIASSLEEYKSQNALTNAGSPKIVPDEYADYYQDTDSEQRKMDVPYQQTI